MTDSTVVQDIQDLAVVGKYDECLAEVSKQVHFYTCIASGEQAGDDV